MAAPIVAETAVRPEGRQVPLPFEPRYDSSRIEPNRSTRWAPRFEVQAERCSPPTRPIPLSRRGTRGGKVRRQRLMQSLLRSRRALRTKDFVWFVGIDAHGLPGCREDPGGEYLEALEGAERFTVDGSTLLIYSKGMDKPLRFIRTKPQRGVSEYESNSAARRTRTRSFHRCCF